METLKEKIDVETEVCTKISEDLKNLSISDVEEEFNVKIIDFDTTKEMPLEVIKKLGNNIKIGDISYIRIEASKIDYQIIKEAYNLA